LAIYRGPGGPGDAVNDAASEVLLALAAKDAAVAAQAAAEAAKTAAELAETNAETAETNAETAETNAETAETNAETAATNAASSASAASTSATNAAASASTATTQATNAASSASAASTSASNASTSASAASTSATNAASSATSASGSASTATTQATNASNSASSASTSATNAANSATAAAASAASINPASIAITGGSINGTTIGATTASTGKFSTLEATGVTTVQAGTVSLPAITTTGDTNTGIFFPAADTIAFTEGGAESMRIDSSGNVGIGIASPVYKLHVNTTFDHIHMTNPTTGTTGGDGFTLDAFGTSARLIQRESAPMEFYTGATERMRLDSSGSLLVGTTSSSFGGRVIVSNDGTTTQTSLSCINTNGSGTMRQIDFFTGTNTSRIGSIESTTTSTSFNTSSDYRLKENIVPMTGALEKIAQLKPVTYKWKINGSDGQGFIAHELQEVVPDCVTGKKDAVDAKGNPDYQGVDTSFLVATLTAAIQELKTEFDAYKATHP
jgi:hypothetical protein